METNAGYLGGTWSDREGRGGAGGAAAVRDGDPAGAAEALRAAAAALSVETHPVKFGLANYDLTGLLLEGDFTGRWARPRRNGRAGIG